MGKTYDMLAPLSLALHTERIEFLKCLSDEDLRNKIDVQLIRDLIEDRVKLREQIVKATDALEQCYKGVGATVIKFMKLQDYLEGNTERDEE